MVQWFFPTFFNLSLNLDLKTTRCQSRRTCTHLLLWELQNYNSLLTNHWQENVGSHQKRIPYVQGQRRSPSKTVRGVKLHLELNPIPARTHSEDSNKTLCSPGNPTETEPDLLLSIWVSPAEVWVGSGLRQGQGLLVQQTWVWHKPSWRRSPLTPSQNCQSLHRTGETDSWRAHTQKTCVHQDPGGRSSDPTRDWPRLARERPGVSGGGVGQRWPAAGARALSTAVCAWDLLKEVAIIFITSTIVWVRSNNREGTQTCPSTEKWIKDLLSMAQLIRIRPSSPHNQSFPAGSFHKPFILICQRAYRMTATITEN